MMFSVTDGVLVHPLPYQDPDTIVVLHTTQKETGVTPRQPFVARAAGLEGARAVVQRDRRRAVPQLHRQRRRRCGSLFRAPRSATSSFRCSANVAAARPRLHRRRRSPGRRAGRPDLGRSLEAPLQRATRRSSAAPSRSTRGRTPSSASCRRGSGFPRTSTSGCRSREFARHASSATRAASRCSPG